MIDFKGKKVVITGSFKDYQKREDLQEILKNLGATCSSAISKSTDILIAGEKAGSKLEKAKELGIKIITEDELKEILK